MTDIRSILRALGEFVVRPVDRPMQRVAMPASATVEAARRELPELREELRCAREWLAELEAEDRDARPPGQRRALVHRLTLDVDRLALDIDAAQHLVTHPPTWELLEEVRLDTSNASCALGRQDAVRELRKGA